MARVESFTNQDTHFTVSTQRELPFILQESLPKKPVEVVRDYEQRVFEQRKNSHLYSVDFSQPFSGPIKPFIISEPIVRSATEPSNLIPALVTFFGTARGSNERPIMVFDWAEIHLKFDVMSTFANYIKAGGWKNLTEEEKDYFLNSYHHANKKPDEHPRLTNGNGGKAVDRIIEFYSRPMNYKVFRVFSGQEMAGLTYVELSHKVKDLQKISDEEQYQSNFDEDDGLSPEYIPKTT